MGIINKKDFIFLLILCMAAAALWLILSMFKGAGSDVVIEVDGVLYGRYALSTDRTIEIDKIGRNRVAIESGQVRMSFADCPGHDCVKEAPIHQGGDLIVCLPNRVIVSIETDGGLDGVVG